MKGVIGKGLKARGQGQEEKLHHEVHEEARRKIKSGKGLKVRGEK